MSVVTVKTVFIVLFRFGSVVVLIAKRTIERRVADISIVAAGRSKTAGASHTRQKVVTSGHSRSIRIGQLAGSASKLQTGQLQTTKDEVEDYLDDPE